ncbi:phage tail protein [Mycolicibacterium boenickei]|nr:phage tail protein [Mycolicibacterium boenickei]
MLDLEPDLLPECEAIWQATVAQKWEEQHLRDEDVLIRLHDGDWNLHHLMRNEYSANFAWISNDSGPAQTEVPFDSPEGLWLYDMWGRMERGEKRNVHITADYCGARWGGRLDKCVVDYREDGDVVVVCDWLHDYENLKWYTVWSNPWLPAAFQFPRAFLLAGPCRWLLLTALHLQLIREHNPLITIPDDPLDFGSYLDVFDQSTWQVVVKPTSFIDDMNAGTVWGVISSRWQNWHDMAHIMLEDAELSVVCRRYLPGDPEPWRGANLRYGTLVIDIVDKSGVHVGTSNGGTMFDGLFRTAAEFADDFIDSTENLIQDTDQPNDYFLPNLRLTHKEFPYVTYRQVETGQHINSPAKGVQVNVGGHSMPGVVCAPPGSRRGTDNLSKSMKLFQRVSKRGSTFSAVSRRSALSAVPSTPSSSPCMRTRSWRGGQLNPLSGRKSQGGLGISSTSRTAPTRHTPSPP